ncbi:MAG: hypothetical protein ACE5HJ_05090 [Thermoplasmata archaeon]
MTHVIPALIAVRVAIVVIGSILTFFAFVRYRQGGSRDHLLLGIGFGLIALGALVEGILFELFGWSLISVHTVEAGLSASGLLVVLLAILLGRR